MTRLRTVAGLLGTVVTAVAAAVAFGPIDAAEVAAAVPRDPGTLAVASVLLAVAVSWLARSPEPVGDEGDPFAAALDPPPEPATADDRRLAGADLDRRIEAAVAGDDAALAAVRERLREAVVAIRAVETDADRERARAAVAAGEWTDDRLAAAFLGDEAATRPPLRARLRRWLDPEAERERRLHRTVDATAELAGESR